MLVPARPGLTNALGCIVADLRHDYVRTINWPLETADISAIHAIFSEQVAAGENALARENVDLRAVVRDFSVDMQFQGQSHVVRVPLENGSPNRNDLRTRFDSVYWKRFRVELSDNRARIVNVNCSVIGERAPVNLVGLIDASGRKPIAEPTSRRMVVFDGVSQDTPIYWRDHLPAEAILDGPAVIEQFDTTTLLPPGDRLESRTDGNLIIHIGAGA